jgi:hypothetical protein
MDLVMGQVWDTKVLINSINYGQIPFLGPYASNDTEIAA